MSKRNLTIAIALAAVVAVALILVVAWPSSTNAPGRTTAAPTPTYQFNVKNYGALGNSTHDDSAAITKALAAAGTAPLYFPTGTYYVGTGYQLPDTAIVKGGPASQASWLKSYVVKSDKKTFYWTFRWIEP